VKLLLLVPLTGHVEDREDPGAFRIFAPKMDAHELPLLKTLNFLFVVACFFTRSVTLALLSNDRRSSKVERVPFGDLSLISKSPRRECSEIFNF
jgi:hypothetical protein